MSDPNSSKCAGSPVFFSIKALRNCRPDRLSRRNPRFDGRERRRQSTLMKILSGALQARSGWRDPHRGQAGRIDGPLGGRAAGISIILPEAHPLPHLSVAENIYLGREISHSGCWRERHASRRRPDARATRRGFRAVDLVAHLSMGSANGRDCPRAARQIEDSDYGRADHPLYGRESERLFALIRQLRAEGLAIIYISHRMDKYMLSATGFTVACATARWWARSTKRRSGPTPCSADGWGRGLVLLQEKSSPQQFGPPSSAGRHHDGGDGQGLLLTVHAGEVVRLPAYGRADRACALLSGLSRDLRPCRTRRPCGHDTTPGEASMRALPILPKTGSAGLFLDMSCSGQHQPRNSGQGRKARLHA